MAKSSNPRLERRGRLVRSLGLLRDMLPGSFVESRLKCGKPSCRCLDGKNLHVHYVLSVLVEGQPKTFHIPGEMVEKVSKQVEMHKRFKEAEATICKLNLGFFLEEKESRKKRKD